MSQQFNLKHTVTIRWFLFHIRNKRSSYFSDNKRGRLTATVLPALLNMICLLCLGGAKTCCFRLSCLRESERKPVFVAQTLSEKLSKIFAQSERFATSGFRPFRHTHPGISSFRHETTLQMLYFQQITMQKTRIPM